MKNVRKVGCIALIVSTFLLSTVIAAATSSSAQEDQLRAKLDATKALMLKMAPDPGYQDSIRKSVFEYEDSLSTHCKSVTLEFDSRDVRLRILWPVDTNQKGVPISGSWKENVPGTACNERRMYNVQVDFTKKGPKFTPTYPGTAKGNPELQRDTLKNIDLITSALAGAKKQCHGDVLNTALVGPESHLQDNGLMSPWNESWDVRVCDKLFTVQVKFTPDGKGTAISVDASGIQAH